MIGWSENQMNIFKFMLSSLCHLKYELNDCDIHDVFVSIFFIKFHFLKISYFTVY